MREVIINSYLFAFIFVHKKEATRKKADFLFYFHFSKRKQSCENDMRVKHHHQTNKIAI